VGNPQRRLIAYVDQRARGPWEKRGPAEQADREVLVRSAFVDSSLESARACIDPETEALESAKFEPSSACVVRVEATLGFDPKPGARHSSSR